MLREEITGATLLMCHLMINECSDGSEGKVRGEEEESQWGGGKDVRGNSE